LDNDKGFWSETSGVVMEWIKCKDLKPDSGMRSLFINGKGEVTFGYAYSYEEWPQEENGSIWINDMDRETNEIATHWMPLPKPPKK
jgi:hypothetical protein